MKFNKPGIAELFNREKLEDIQDKIGKATGMAFVTVDYTGDPITKMSCFVDFCKTVRADQARCEVCKKSDAFGALQAAISHKPFVYFCPCGFLEVAIPIEYEGAFLGGFIGGQVICEDAPSETVRLSQLFDSGEGSELSQELLELKPRAKKYPYAQFMDIVNLIHLIIDQLYEANASKFTEGGTQEEFARLKTEKAELKTRLGHMEHKISLLQANQNPYFFANTLSTISGMSVLENAEKTNELILTLSEYYQSCVRDPDGFWTLGEELDLCRKYIRLTCSRFGDRFTFQIHVSDKLTGRRIPVYSILPYVQDAVYYGINLKKEDANLSVSVSMEKDELLVVIAENGPGYDQDALREMFREFRGRHEGEFIDRLRYRTEKRILEIFGEAYLPVVSVGKGVGRKFQIRIPLWVKESDKQ